MRLRSYPRSGLCVWVTAPTTGCQSAMAGAGAATARTAAHALRPVAEAPDPPVADRGRDVVRHAPALPQRVLGRRGRGRLAALRGIGHGGAVPDRPDPGVSLDRHGLVDDDPPRVVDPQA